MKYLSRRSRIRREKKYPDLYLARGSFKLDDNDIIETVEGTVYIIADLKRTVRLFIFRNGHLRFTCRFNTISHAMDEIYGET